MSKDTIANGSTCLGIEFGSTRIKAVLTDLDGKVLAIGFHDWENSLVDGIWTYSETEIYEGLRSCYKSLKDEVKKQYDVALTSVGCIGISAMMHGYIALDKDDKMLAPFQTWRNSNTGAAADTLTELFNFNIPLRWTISHIYQRILDGEAHVKDIDFVTTLDSFIHYKLTGEKVTGIGDASGIFPIDSETLDYDASMVAKFDGLIADKKLPWKLLDVLPKVLVAGDLAGKLTEDGAALLDPDGDLKAGIPMCPPEGDAGTGMVATNSVAPGTGNVSAGTSTFAMLVLEKGLSALHREIDMVTTPSGHPVAMSHANNGTSDLNSWVGLFHEFAGLMGLDVSIGDVFEKLYLNSLKGEADPAGLMAYGYLSGEGITGLNEGRPMFVRTPDAKMNLANFMRTNLYSSLGAVSMGMNILLRDEAVRVSRITGHGGLFKTKGVAQRYLSAAVDSAVTVMDNAGEGGPWGMAVLAAYSLRKNGGHADEKLEDFLDNVVFKGAEGSTVTASAEEVEGFKSFLARYEALLPIEREAVEKFR